MHYLLGALVLVVIGGCKLFNLAAKSTKSWGDYVVKGERPWDDENKK